MIEIINSAGFILIVCSPIFIGLAMIYDMEN
jgi:hypothetical protein